MSIRLFRVIRRSGAASARMVKSRAFTRVSAVALLAAAMVSLYGAFAVPVHGTTSNPRVNLGAENQFAPIGVTVWLKLHNEAALDAMVKDMYDKSSPNYHHWLTPAQYKSQFAPTAQDAATVRDFLASNNLKVVAIDPNHHFVRAEGQVGDAQRAFNTQINRVMVNGEVHRVAASQATISGPTSAMVEAVQGLSDVGSYRANVTPSKNPDTLLAYDGVSPNSAGADGLFFSADCLRGVQTKTFTTNGGLPKATYTGYRYGADVAEAQPPNLPPCGYDANEIQTAYGLKPLIKSGLDGSGQTIVIVDAFGSNTILADANLFSQLNGLPPLKTTGPDANFEIIKPTGPTHCGPKNGCITGNWQYETTLDVEWAHAVAPGAKIILVVAADNSFTNLDAANQYAIDNQLGSVISNSFGIPEIVLVEYAPSELNLENRLAKLAAAMGISQNVSTGDSGDNLALDTAAFGLPVTSSGANDSPFVTTVGGTSTFLNDSNGIKLQTGWDLISRESLKPNPIRQLSRHCSSGSRKDPEEEPAPTSANRPTKVSWRARAARHRI